jgi:PHP family Zn ribbon phosphoesterase
MALRRFRADLHIHSCLSPCGELNIYPQRIVERALEMGLDIIALTDHNTAENAGATLRAARGTNLTVLPGMEVTTQEEVHLLGLFPSLEAALSVQEEVYRRLPDIPSRRSLVRDQVIVNEKDEVTGFNARCLIGAAELDVYKVVALVHGAGGLAIASHIDREAFSLISQLGFLPPDLELDAVEVSPLTSVARARDSFESCSHLPFVRFSDAHRPEEIGRASTDFVLASPSVEEIRAAFRGTGGRRVGRP